ncbi:MAG: Uma2 family endonuclease [Oscillatoriales cyanobacterium SM2_1_8]|nr:Uma2 family endonuclease [Oscillatoriales cyanobacterium SM2_1_8]
MAITLTTQLLTFQEYLTQLADTDIRSELAGGKLAPLAPPTGRHTAIARHLFRQLDREITERQQPWVVTYGDVGVRTGPHKVRLPDLTVITTEQATALWHTAAILESPPLLAIEIISAEDPNRDYRYKRAEYAALEVPEYWILDPHLEKATVLTWVNGDYEGQEFAGDEGLVSSLLTPWTLPISSLLLSGAAPTTPQTAPAS